MANSSFPSSLAERTQRVAGLMERLGTTHFGIDAEIQRLLDSFIPWYQFAEAQERPRTIGLWGMTGTGKSSLVRALAKEAGLEDRTFWLDAGECHDKYWLDKFFDQLEESLDGQPFIVVVDEFQHARTVDPSGAAIKEPHMLRRFWELLDSGRVILWPEGWVGPGGLEQFRDRLVRNLAEGMVVHNGKIAHAAPVPRPDDELPLDQEPRKEHWAVPRNLWDLMREAHIGKKPTETEFLVQLSTMDGNAILEWIEMLQEARMARRVVHAGKALIILLGNLDELYVAEKEPMSELHPDVLLRRHRDIGRAGVQHALLQLFRIEQVGRMGTSHIVFPPIGQAIIDRLVQREVDQHLDRLSALTGHAVELGASLIDHLRTTSAIAVLGARPVVQAVQHTVPHLLSQALRSTVPDHTGTIHLAVKKGKPVAVISTKTNGPLEVELTWPTDNRTEGNGTDAQRERVAAHESGHLLCGVLLAGKTPLQVCASTRAILMGGFVVWDKQPHGQSFLQSEVVPELATVLGGWAAEQVVYGAEGVSDGSAEDLHLATGMALYWAKKTAFGSSRMHTADHATSEDIGFRGTLTDAEEQAKQWIQAAEDLALATMREHSHLLDKCRKLLMEKGSLGIKELEELTGEITANGSRRGGPLAKPVFDTVPLEPRRTR